MKKLQHPVYATLLAIIIVLLTGYAFAFNMFYSVSPFEYIISIVEDFDHSPRGVFNKAWRIVKTSYLDNTLNKQDWRRWKRRYANKIETEEDLRVAADSMLASLDDPYTRYLPKDEYEEQHRTINSKMQGIGVHITEVDSKIIIVSVIEDTPAEKYGLKSKDEILKVESISTKGLLLKDVANIIRGEKGTFVTLTILRGNETLVKKIKREEIKIKTVKYKMLDNNIVYIRIVSFISSNTFNEFSRALYASRDASGLVVDVRGNYGGLLSNAVYISDIFMDEGNIVSTVNRKGIKTDFDAEPGSVLADIPIVVLVDEASASASEIFSGAMQDNKRAILVGERTFGKGLVQMVAVLPDGSGMNFTVAKYLTPSGRNINKKGIEPDYKVEYKETDVENEEDTQLDKAVEILREEICKCSSPALSESN